MDYDCSLRGNQFPSLSDTEANDSAKYDGNKNGAPSAGGYPSPVTVYRRHSHADHPRSSYHYATISSATNPYLPASEYVYRRRHDNEMLNEAPLKPERKSRNNKRSVSLNAYDGRKLFSPLRTYCVLMKENIEPESDPITDEASEDAINVAATGPRSGPPPTSTTSAILNNSSPISLSLTSSSTPHKFNSLPRERYIRIEREDGDGSTNVEKYSSLKFPARNKNDLTLLGKSSFAGDYHPRISPDIGGVTVNKNVTRVPITKDDSSIGLSFTSRPNNITLTSTGGSPPKTKIERSQSYREISSSRPYPYYHQNHPHHLHQSLNASPTSALNLHQQRHNFPLTNLPGTGNNKASAVAGDLNFSSAGTTSTLPNFRSKTTSSSPSSYNKNVWDTNNPNGPSSSNFFRSDFDDGSDVVIENFIKTHSTASNSASNTLPKRKYLPSTTHISNSSAPRRASADDKEYHKDNPLNSSDFGKKGSIYQHDSSPGTNYLRQCSTFPRGAGKTDHSSVDGLSHQQMQTEQLPNYEKNNYSNMSSSSPPSKNSSADIPKGYPYVDKLDVFFQPASSFSNQFDVPKQFNGNNQNNPGTERILPIKMQAAMTGPGSSATLPHPYIRRNKYVHNNASDKPQPSNSNGATQDKLKDAGPSISEVEMDIERDIYFQKTRSLDRARPSSKSKLKSMLSLGRSNTTAGDNHSKNGNSNHPHFSTMEIDYSDSQPYNNMSNKGRLQHLHENLLNSIDQVDRSYANGRNNTNNMNGKSLHGSNNNDPLEPQQVHHSPPTVPIPSPRLKRKAKLHQQQHNEPQTSSMITTTTIPTSSHTTLCSPKISGDEMSSSTSSKLIGPGTNYGSKKLPSSSSSPQLTGTGGASSSRLLNEPDHHYNGRPQQIIRNELDTTTATTTSRGGGGAPTKTNAPIINKSSSATNPISTVGNTTSLNATGAGFSTKFSLPKETSIKPDSALNSVGISSSNNIGSANGGVDAIIKSEKSLSGTNHISQPSPTGPHVTPNYANSDSPGVNFMISSSVNEFDLTQQHQPFPSGSHSPGSKYFGEMKTKPSGTPAHIPPIFDHSPASSSPHNNHQQIKSALVTNSTENGGGGGSKQTSGGNGVGGGKAVRFEPHIIAMEIESEQRKLLQQLSLAQQGGPAVNNNHNSNNNNNNMNSGDAPSASSINGGSSNGNPSGAVSGMKSNSGNHSHHHNHHPHHHMHRHGHHANKGSRQQHYVHANSYLPVLYHSYHQQQHKYIRKGTTGITAGGVGSPGGSLKGGKGKSKKYKGFVARAIAKVKSKAAAAAASSKKGESSAAPTVYYPVGRQGSNSKPTFSQPTSQQPYYNSALAAGNNANNAPTSSSVITYISPQPLAQHQQPPVQQSLEESSATLQQEQFLQQKASVPSITVSLTSTQDDLAKNNINGSSSPSSSPNIAPGAADVLESNPSSAPTKHGILINSPSSGSSNNNNKINASVHNSVASPVQTKVISESSKKYTTPGGKLSKNLYHHHHHHSPKNTKNHKGLAQLASGINQRRMDGYIDNLDVHLVGGDNGDEDEDGMPIPDSFRLQMDRITPSSTSSSSSSFTSNLQESYELFHNQTIPERVHQLVTTTTVAELSEDDDGINEDDDEERLDGRNGDEAPHANKGIDGAAVDLDDDMPYKSFDESDFGEDEDEEPDFVFYPTPPHLTTVKQPLGTLTSANNNNTTSAPSSGSARHPSDTDRNKGITTSSADAASHAPFASNNETTTKGNNNISGGAQYADLARDSNNDGGAGNNHNISNSSMRNKGKFYSVEPKMVVGIPTYRSPNSRRLINSHHQQHHYGKSQASIPNPTTTSTLPPPPPPSSTSVSSSQQLANSKENVKQSSSSQSSSAAAAAKTFSALFKEPHPSHQHHQFSTTTPTNNNEKVSSSSKADMMGVTGATFGMKHSSIFHSPTSSSNNRQSSPMSAADVNECEGMKQAGSFMSQSGKSVEQHRQNENQVNEHAKDVHAPSLQQQSLPPSYQDDITKNIMSKGMMMQRQSERGRSHSRGGSCEEHDRYDAVDDHHHDYNDEDTLQKEHAQEDKNGDAYITTGHNHHHHKAHLNVADSCTERISSDNPPDAKKNTLPPAISTSDLPAVQRIASATTTSAAAGKSTATAPSSNSTVGALSPSILKWSHDKKYEGRLTDLTTATITTSHGPQHQQLTGLARADPKSEDVEEGLLTRSGATNAKFLHSKNSTQGAPLYISSGSGGGGDDNNINSNNVWGNKLVNLKNHNSSVQQEEDPSLLQARTSSSSSPPSWANRSAPNSNNNNSSKRKTHTTVTNNSASESHQKDIERLERLELVKTKQHNILTHINNTTSTGTPQKANFKISTTLEQDNDVSPSHISSEAILDKPRLPSNYYPYEQPNSLETQCANDQSFLSESDVSSKSPSPSPRFKSRKFAGPLKAGGGGGRTPSPKFHAAPGNKCAAGDSEEDVVQHHHLLNAPQTRSPQQGSNKERQSKSGARRTPAVAAAVAQQEGSKDHPEDQLSSRTLYYPDSGPFGMSILPPQQPQQHSPHTTTAASSSSSDPLNENNTSNFGRFKSRILLNSDDLEDDEELARVVADVVKKSVNGSSKNSRPTGPPPVPPSVTPGGGGAKRNITTVEISGDVGIVSSNLHHQNLSTSGGKKDGANFATSSSLADKKASGSITKRKIPHEHLQSSGLSYIQQPSSLHDSSDEDTLEKPIKPEIRTKLVDQVKGKFNLSEEVGSSVSANESSGDNDTEKVSTSDDNSSDWQSESTNTVIFRGHKKPVTPSSSSDLGDGSTSTAAQFYDGAVDYLDPEIQINNITIGDRDSDIAAGGDSGSGLISPLAHMSRDNNATCAESGNKSSNSGTVNVGYKASKVNKVSTDLIIGIKKSSSDNTTSPSHTHIADSDGASVKVGSKRKFDKNNDVSSSSSSSSAGDSSEELGKSNETLTDIPVTTPDQQHPDDQQISEDMVMHQDKKEVNGKNSRLYVQNNTKSPHHRRESPEGQEQEVPDRSCSEEKDKGSKEKKVLSPSCVKEASIDESNPAAIPNAKEKKMEETSGSGCSNMDAANGGVKPKKHGKAFSRGTISKEKILQNVLSQIPSRSSPDGADADKSDATPEPEVESPTPTGVMDNFDVTSDEDSWVEEILFEDEDDASFEEAAKKLPPPLDLTLHTIVEESCEESEAENSGNFYQPSTSGLGSQKNPSLSQSESNANELEKYFNYGIYTDPGSASKNSLPHEESEFSDTFSESSFSLQEDDFDNGVQEGLLDPAELASTRLEKYFYNLGGPQSMMNPMQSTIINQHAADSDSVGSESDSDNSVLEKRKKVLKHHRRSADFEEEFGDKVSDEEDSFGFGQDGFDTIKKTARKTKKSGSDGSITNENSMGSSGNPNSPGGMTTDHADSGMDPNSSVFERKSPAALKKSDSSESSSSKTSPSPSGNEKPVIKVNRSNSFTWSSDEEVNIMMSKLRQLIKNLIKSKAEAGNASDQQGSPSSGAESSPSKDKQLVYLENELIRYFFHFKCKDFNILVRNIHGMFIKKGFMFNILRI